MKNYKHFHFITGMFTAVLILSNILDTKIFAFYSLALPAGIILFPIAYIFGDILTEVYGYSNSRKVIWTGFFALLLMVISVEIARILPSASFWGAQESYNIILGKVPRIVLASITAYFVGEFINSFILAKLKLSMGGKNMPVRFIMSTLVGQAFDTTVFVLIAFLGSMPMGALFSIILSGWLFKVVWEVIALPLTIPIVKWLKKQENEDFFDVNTNFNPFTTQK